MEQWQYVVLGHGSPTDALQRHQSLNHEITRLENDLQKKTNIHWIVEALCINQ